MRPLKAGQVPLERALSKLGLASRAQARVLILAGKVKVNGTLRLDPLFGVNPERAKFEIEGEKVSAPEMRTFLLHKPRGVVTTRSDEKGRKTVFALLREGDAHLSAVGRLDLATSGVLLITNDTKLSHWLTEPKNEVPRVYVVSVRGEVSEEKLTQLRTDGIEDRGEFLKVDQVRLQKSSGKESHLEVTLKEGKNREIRRIFLALGHEVTRLKRIAYGGIQLGKLQPGEYRELSIAEIKTAFPGAPLR